MFASTSIPGLDLLIFMSTASKRRKLSTRFQAQGRIAQVGKGRGWLSARREQGVIFG
jgi:hypothetical protein